MYGFFLSLAPPSSRSGSFDMAPPPHPPSTYNYAYPPEFSYLAASLYQLQQQVRSQSYSHSRDPSHGQPHGQSYNQSYNHSHSHNHAYGHSHNHPHNHSHNPHHPPSHLSPSLQTHRLRAIASLKVTSHFLTSILTLRELPDYDPAGAPPDGVSPSQWVVSALRQFLARLEREVDALWRILEAGGAADGWSYSLRSEAELPWYLEPYHLKILMFMADFFENAMRLRVNLGLDHKELKVWLQVPLRFEGSVRSGQRFER